MRRLFVLLGAMLCVSVSYAQKYSVAFYNVENLFDTIPSLFYDDSDYTPEGRYGWNTERYRNDIKNIARVLDDVRADVVGLCEIENEDVVRDLVRALHTDYCYVHLTSRDAMGRDLALLYKGDKFEVLESWLSESGYRRDFLNVRGVLGVDTVQFVVCHLPSTYNSEAQYQKSLTYLENHVNFIRQRYPSQSLFVIGDINGIYNRRLRRRFGYEAPLCKLENQGYGSYLYRGRWSLIDNIFVCEAGGFSVADCGIYLRSYMLYRTAYGEIPYRTFSRDSYLGGYSDHLPVYIILQR